jgi:E3 ubiquitin-protein ligase CHFR
LHTFCAGCYSEWMPKSQNCPTCRNKVDRISKNHILNNLIDAYLKKNPTKIRSDSDIKELDSKNKITHDMVLEIRFEIQIYK